MRAETLLTSPRPALELWAGMECTLNRVQDEYLDQLERTGHAARPGDLDLLAGLGARRVRYPVLWERTAPDGVERADWTWADERLHRLRALGVQPIVGLVHHGSGPRHTSLLDPAFPEKLAAYARAVAERYPWVDAYTPVNEPLTTARFSALYGHWYPHARDPGSFARALLHQYWGTVLAMRAIRAVNPAAQLVQTDDLGTTFSTPRLAYQASFQNELRWVTWDLLCGALTPDRPLWRWLREAGGLAEAELARLQEHACPPEIIGINHYLTSDRFLDERLERYPPSAHGGNGLHAYADVEAVRVRAEGIGGVRRLLGEAWQRYQRPLAITETHLGCTREEQVRWLAEVWQAAATACEDGADVRAVTVWSAFGAYDWDSLLTRRLDHYEPGVFDVRTPAAPRPTALASLARDLAAGQTSCHPALGTPGWWRQLDRFEYQPVASERVRRGAAPRPLEAPAHAAPAPLLVVGARGLLGAGLARQCVVRHLPARALTRRELDVSDADAVAAALDGLRPWAVVNAAGFVGVDEAEREPEACFRDNVQATEVLAEACARRGTRLLTFSSDLVFDGARGIPYVEDDEPGPLGVYGWSKLEAERRALERCEDAFVVRTSACFGPWDAGNFVQVALSELAAGRRFVAADDAVVSPTYVPDLVEACLDLLLDGERGIWHLVNAGATTWFALAQRAATLANVPTATLVGRPTAALRLAAPRPLYSALASQRGWLMPSLEDALSRFVGAAAASASWRSGASGLPRTIGPEPLRQGSHPATTRAA